MSIGIIGTGFGVRVQVPGFRAAGLEIVALAGRNPEKTAQLAREHDIPFATHDWREVLARSEVKVVSITTPPDLHLEMTLAALAAGKHVICEKPFAMNADEALKMWEAAQAHPDLLTIIDHELRFLPALQLARQMIADGVIGPVRHILTQVVDGGWADPNRAWDWWTDAASGGGIWGAIGSHHIDTMRFLTGVEVENANGMVHTFIPERPHPHNGEMKAATADDFYSARLQLSNGAFANMLGSVVTPTPYANTLSFFGGEGALSLVRADLQYAPKGEQFSSITPAHTVEIPAKLQNSPFHQGTVYLGHALRAYLDGDKSALADAATFEDGWRIQQVLDAVRESKG